MQAIVAILMYLNLLAPGQSATPAQINAIMQANQSSVTVAMQNPGVVAPPIVDPNEQN